ncbi:hypothetical protein ACGFNV_30925 [Streptomyces sp. NPDC048751]|uniref:hypothetical protein n=1 Tax=Streptomyces sp. NPDC048751 TaxID=3365591 RepID=UPI0037152224
MCNPRRVRVTATREVAEAWQVELERRVALSDTVVSELEISFPFGGTLGDRTRAVFEGALARDPHWRETSDGAHELPLPDGTVTYRPADGTLVVRARLTDTARAEGVAAETLHGTVRDVAHGEGRGSYYDDNWRGRTRRAADAEARRIAESAAEHNARALLDSVRRRAQEASASAERAADDRVRQAATADAAARLETERARVRDELDARNRVRVERLGQEALRAVNAVLALAYREALVAFAREQGAREVRVDESEDSIAVEFEMGS